MDLERQPGKTCPFCEKKAVVTSSVHANYYIILCTSCGIQFADEDRDALINSWDRRPREDKYNELLYAVAQKFPGETRHETALRYIKWSESNAITAAAEEFLDKGGKK